MVGLSAAAGALVTVAVALSPVLYFAYDRPELHLILETAEGLIGLLVVYLITGRVRESRRLSDVLLLYALAVLSVTNLVSTVPAAFLATNVEALTTSGPLWTRLIGTLAFAMAAFVPFGRRIRQSTTAAVAAAVATVAVGVIVAQLAQPLLPDLVSATTPRSDLSHADLRGHPLVHITQLASAALFALASLGFVRRAERHGDELMAWIAAAATVNAFARANYFLFPSLYSEYVYSGDVLRLGSYLLLLVGASREIRSYWLRAADSAVEAERRKIARDLHDGLAQELSFVATQVRRLGRRPEVAGVQSQLERIASASQRALDESRRAIDYLVQPHDEPLGTLLAHAAEQVAGRSGARVRATADGDVEVVPDVAEQLVRIVREAVTNATRHGEARTIDLTVRDGDGLLLRIADDGAGFDPQATDARTGFGLTSMRERAERIGGVFVLRSEPGEGTIVEVRVPSRTASES